MKAERERIIITAHQTELMARTKKLRSVDHYLKPPKAGGDGSAVAAMLQKLSQSGGGVRVKRIRRRSDD